MENNGLSSEGVGVCVGRDTKRGLERGIRGGHADSNQRFAPRHIRRPGRAIREPHVLRLKRLVSNHGGIGLGNVDVLCDGDGDALEDKSLVEGKPARVVTVYCARDVERQSRGRSCSKAGAGRIRCGSVSCSRNRCVGQRAAQLRDVGNVNGIRKRDQKTAGCQD